MVKSKLFIEVGGYSEIYARVNTDTGLSHNFIGMIEDSDLCLRMREKNKEIVSFLHFLTIHSSFPSVDVVFLIAPESVINVFDFGRCSWLLVLYISKRKNRKTPGTAGFKRELSRIPCKHSTKNGRNH
jgi:hypothetical protein